MDNGLFKGIFLLEGKGCIHPPPKCAPAYSSHFSFSNDSNEAPFALCNAFSVFINLFLKCNPKTCKLFFYALHQRTWRESYKYQYAKNSNLAGTPFCLFSLDVCIFGSKVFFGSLAFDHGA